MFPISNNFQHACQDQNISRSHDFDKCENIDSISCLFASLGVGGGVIIGWYETPHSSFEQKKISNDPLWDLEATFDIRDPYGLCPGLYFVYNSLVFIFKSDLNKVAFLQQTKSKTNTSFSQSQTIF